jgi:hypothetical protein
MFDLLRIYQQTTSMKFKKHGHCNQAARSAIQTRIELTNELDQYSRKATSTIACLLLFFALLLLYMSSVLFNSN